MQNSSNGHGDHPSDAQRHDDELKLILARIAAASRAYVTQLESFTAELGDDFRCAALTVAMEHARAFPPYQGSALHVDQAAMTVLREINMAETRALRRAAP